MKILLTLIALSTLISCTQPRAKRYRDLIEPKIGTSKKDEINKLLGEPTWCREEAGSQKCEYRTSKARNAPVPDAYRKEPGLGPDLSPYDHFDVLHLYYDAFGTLKDWEPIVVAP